MVTDQGTRIGIVLLSLLLFLSVGWHGAEAITITATSGVITGYSTISTINIAGPEFTLVAQSTILDSVDFTNCLYCQAGQNFNPFFLFREMTGTLIRQGVTYALHGFFNGSVDTPGMVLPTTVGPAFSTDLPFSFGIGIPRLDLNLVGSGVLPLTFAPAPPNQWHRNDTGYQVRVPEPSQGWLLLGSLLMLVGVGWLVRRSRAAGTCTTTRDQAVLTISPSERQRGRELS